MNGKQLRGAMWKQIKGRRGYLLLGLLITMTPIMLQSIITTAANVTIPYYLGSPAGILSNLLTIGLCKIAMDQVGDGEKRMGNMFFFLKNGALGKALVLSLVLWVVNTAFSVLPGLLAQHGVALMGMAKMNVDAIDQGLLAQGEIFYGLGQLLNLACSFITMVLLFPIQYRFALYPEQPVMDQLAEGVSLGWKNFRGVFGYRFLVSLPIGVLMMAYLGATMFLPEYALFVIAAFVVLFCFYMPFITLAEAALAKRLFVLEEQGGQSGTEPATARRRKG